MKKLIFLLLVFGLLFADIGPVPEDPDITIYSIYNGELSPNYFELEYFCTEPTGNEGSSPVDDRYITFSCTEGDCFNQYWFYKLNPCFSGADGYFIYQYEGEETHSETVSFNSGQSYTLYLEVTTGELSDQLGGDEEDQEDEDDVKPLCSSAFVILFLLLGVSRNG